VSPSNTRTTSFATTGRQTRARPVSSSIVPVGAFCSSWPMRCRLPSPRPRSTARCGRRTWPLAA